LVFCIRFAEADEHQREYVSKYAGLAKPSMSILGKCRVVRELLLETEPGEPTIGQVHSDLFQQTTLAANAVDPPGAYGNVNINAGATITLTGGPPNSRAIYTMNSITVGGGSQVVIQGGAVVLNIAGINQQNPISFAGNSIQNLTGIPKNFVIS